MKTINNFLSIFSNQLKAMHGDLHVYWSKRGGHSLLSSLLYMITCHGWHIMVWFRVGKIIYAIPVPIVSHICKIFFQLGWYLLTTFYGIFIDLTSTIGKGFYIGHYGGILVRGNIGEYCSIGQGVTIGSKGAGKSNGWPTLEHNVYIGVGAKVIGNIHIGNDVIVGANAVVTVSIPDKSLALGIPAKIKARNDL